MDKELIKNIRNRYFNDFWNLYERSFPIIEKRTLNQQENLFIKENYKLEVFYEEKVFIGFLSYWKFDNYIYLEHFAINEQLRGQGLGKKVLTSLLNKIEEVVILEIDPIVDEKSLRRLRFYKRLEFKRNDFAYKAPAYKDKAQLYDLVIMTYPRLIAQTELDMFKNDFKNLIF